MAISPKEQQQMKPKKERHRWLFGFCCRSICVEDVEVVGKGEGDIGVERRVGRYWYREESGKGGRGGRIVGRMEWRG